MRGEPPGRWRRARWVLALLPLAAGVLVWAAARGGLLPDRRTGASLSALPQDWALAAGLVLSALACAGAAIAARADAVGGARLRRQAAASAEDRRLLLSRLDHELKNPLTAMRAAVANLTADAGGAASGAVSTQLVGLRSIEEQAVRLSRLTADLRKIADVRAGALDRAPVDLTGLLQDAVTVVRDQPLSAARDLRLDLPRAPWPLPLVAGDQDLLELAVINLLDNAVKYTPAGGTIEVRAREASGQVLVEVADTGPGISPEDLPHIWEELYRSPRARTVAGSGLGLPLVRAVVERHGGTVSAESRLGHGTAVRLHLPVTAPDDGG